MQLMASANRFQWEAVKLSRPAFRVTVSDNVGELQSSRLSWVLC